MRESGHDMYRWRGRLNTMVQTGTFIGLVCASAINVGSNHLIWGWRLSLGLAAVPGSILLLGASFVSLMSDTCYIRLSVD